MTLENLDSSLVLNRALTQNFLTKRIDIMHDLARITSLSYLKIKNIIHFEGLEKLKSVKDSGFILLPRHESYFDVPVETNYLYQAGCKRAFYLMKSSLNPALEYCGAIKVLRKKEVLDMPKQERKKVLSKFEWRSSYIDSLVSHLINTNNPVVIHPEAGMNVNGPFKPRLDLIERLTRIPTLQNPIFVAFDIQYLTCFGKRIIYAKAGTPLETRKPELLYDYLLDNIPYQYNSKLI